MQVHHTSKSTVRGGNASNQLRSAMTMDSRRTKSGGGGGGDLNFSRSATVHRSAGAQSPSLLEAEQQEEEQGSSGLVISNRHNSSMSSFLEDDEDGTEADGVMEDLNKEEEETLSLLIDRRLLHKDFIVDKFSLAQVYFRKVSVDTEGIDDELSDGGMDFVSRLGSWDPQFT